MSPSTQWQTSATEVRASLPHLGIADLGIEPTVTWQCLETVDGADEWVTVEDDRFVPGDPAALLRVRANVELTEEQIANAEGALPGFRLGMMVRAAGGSARGRAIRIHEGFGSCRLELELAPHTWRGSVAVEVMVITIDAPEESGDSMPPPDAPIWTGRPLTLAFDSSDTSQSGGFDVVWSDDLLEHQLFKLVKSPEGEGIRPRLFLNGQHEGLEWAWSAPGTSGHRARARKLLTAMVAVDVLLDLAVWAAEVDVDNASPEDIKFKEQVQRALAGRFRVRSELLQGIEEDVEKRDQLRSVLQASKSIRMAGSASAVVQSMRSLVGAQ
ncbi:MAG: hypothetical protein ACYSWX_14510 [Planctomycetota bacterium]|jgi:hypothetical protein